jgi:hypothetical protein
MRSEFRLTIIIVDSLARESHSTSLLRTDYTPKERWLSIPQCHWITYFQ